ncbi:ATP-binding protein, partial [Enterobacter asburiae]
MSGQVPANLERLFDRFYRADSSRFYNTEGAGLGLSITRSIIHAHGGADYRLTLNFYKYPSQQKIFVHGFSRIGV